MHKQLSRVVMVHLQTLMAVVLIALLCGCGEGQQFHSDIKARQPSSEQSTCANRTATKQVALAGEFAKQQLDAMKEHRSTIELTMLERRMNENTCLEEANCFGDDVLVVGTLFDSCLKRVERNGASD